MDNKMIEEWELQIRETKSLHTADAYIRDVKQWFSYCEQVMDKTKEEAFLEYCDSLISTQKQATASRKLCAIRKYYEFCKKCGGVDITEDVVFPTMPKSEASKEELELVVENLVPESATELRDLLLFLFLTETNLSLEQILWIKTKEGIPESVSYKMKKTYEKYCAYNNPREYLFANKAGKPISRQMVWKRIKEYQNRYGIKKDYAKA